MAEVTRTRTPAEMASVAHAIAAEWPLAFPAVRLTEAILANILALVDLETAGGASIWNYNLGNIVAVNLELPWFAGYDRENLRRFRAWGSLREGARGLIKQLMSETRPEWKRGLLSGDPITYAHALGGAYGGPRYYEAPIERYTQTFLERWQRYRPANAPTPVPRKPGAPPRSSKGGAVALVVVALVGALGAVLMGGSR